MISSSDSMLWIIWSHYISYSYGEECCAAVQDNSIVRDRKYLKLLVIWYEIYELVKGSRALEKVMFENNSDLIFLISLWKHMFWPLFRTISARKFEWGTTIYVHDIILKTIPNFACYLFLSEDLFQNFHSNQMTTHWRSSTYYILIFYNSL